MGFLDDLIQTIQEAAAEARGEPPPKRTVRDPAEQPSQQQQRPIEVASAQQRQRQGAHYEASSFVPLPVAIEPPSDSSDRQALARPAKAVVGDIARYRRLLNDPVYRRDLIVLKEILDRPLSQRRRR